MKGVNRVDRIGTIRGIIRNFALFFFFFFFFRMHIMAGKIPQGVDKEKMASTFEENIQYAANRLQKVANN